MYYTITLFGFGFLAYWFNRHMKNDHHVVSQQILDKEKNETILSKDDNKVLDKDQREDMRDTVKLRCTIMGAATMILLVLVTNVFNKLMNEDEFGISSSLLCALASTFVTVMITLIKLLFSDVQLLKLSDIQKFELAGSDKNYEEIFTTLTVAAFTNMMLIGILMGVIASWPDYVSLFNYEYSLIVIFYLSFIAFLVSQFSFGDRLSPNVRKALLSLSVFLFAIFTIYVPK